jgi:DNA (cytosine-5)-methyltransferase 1
VDCQHYGVPQRRRRLIVMASRYGPIQIPAPTHGRAPGLLPVSTVSEWIGDLPAISAGEADPSVPNHLASALTDLNMKRLEATPPGGGRADWPPELRLTCHAQHNGHCDVYGRMRADAPAPALTTKCTSISNGRFGHPVQHRPISVREAASLQTFPRDFIFEGGIKSATRQIGNAVPVLLAQRMGEAFLSHLCDHAIAAEPSRETHADGRDSVCRARRA